MDRKKDAAACFDMGFNCCQAVFSAFSNEYGLDTETASKIACGFGGGMRKGDTCGAVTGALMVIGLKHGHFAEGDLESKQKTYSLVSEFQRKFSEINGSVICKELLGHDLSTADGMTIINQKGLFKTLCPKYIEDSISILEKMFNEAE